MRQTKLDKRKPQESSATESKEFVEEKPADGMKRKALASEAEAKDSSLSGDVCTKSRKEMCCEDQESGQLTDSGSDEVTAPTKLTRDQRKIDDKLKGNDFENIKRESGSKEE